MAGGQLADTVSDGVTHQAWWRKLAGYALGAMLAVVVFMGYRAFFKPKRQKATFAIPAPQPVAELQSPEIEPPLEPTQVVALLQETKPEGLFLAEPTIARNPNFNRVPLVAIVDFQAVPGVEPSLRIKGPKHEWVQPCETRSGRMHRVAVLGMRPNREHEIIVELKNPQTGEVATSEPLKWKTVKLRDFRRLPRPRYFPPLEVKLAKPEKMEPGVTLFAVNFWNDRKSFMTYGYIIALDNEGEVVWFYNTGHRIADMRVMKNGHILYIHAGYRHALEIDLLGNKFRQWHTKLANRPNRESILVDMDTTHHELMELPNGNLMTLSTKLYPFDSYPTSETDPDAPWEPADVVADEVVEFVPDTGEIVHRLPVIDLLDKKRFGYMALGKFWRTKYDKRFDVESRDWSHANAMYIDPKDGHLVVSFRHQDCLMKINRKQGEIIWIMGDPGNWSEPWQKYLLKPVGENFAWHYHQHAPQMTPQGTILMYDNGNFRALPYDQKLPADENQSRVVEYEVDEEKMTVRQVWEYRGEPNDTFFCPFYCEAEWMPETGNILVTDGGHIETEEKVVSGNVPDDHQWARIFEITRSDPPEKVFEIAFESPPAGPQGWSIYRSMRLESLNMLTVDFDHLGKDDESDIGEVD